ncbi:sugar ABC transporter [Synechococcus sp. HB1133]|uniref:ABC transporter permease n=1 Tax=unclassified Synechococcus TaxID=2626047 RepID=UPI00140B1B43|nr:MULTISPECIES: ABC transporter permease [unclassified Synechococcus]MCB4394214.1 sugar ABC transporter [Synechococcus sp. PH41509]MCB4423423.1 sugar ABC transporter [Synechococcus sp. HB1133]MCB4431466.1 sugar ABC transporter [Synechococcus sp. HBA1120]NHI82371.1 sugar ABC transporter [Synechococcus sp. HB1133]
MNFLRKLFNAIWRQVAIVLAIATYENNRKSTGTSIGAWESIVTPLQIMLFFIVMRVGFAFLRGSNRFAAGGSTDMYFNIVVFIASGFALAFLFRQGAIKALSGLKLRAPLYYKRIQPLDILLALLVNDFRAISTISLAILGLVWYFTWTFQLDSPGLAISVYLLTIFMALGFGICLVFLGRLNKWITRILKRILQRLIIFTSGIFFATFELPEYTRPFVTWNPILHAVELFRYSMNNEYPIPDISLSYLIWCSMILLGFSLILYRTNESVLLEANDD